jgi:ESS family glutamate:Na+ symporter
MSGAEATIVELDPVRVLVLSIVVLWAGERITARLPFLQRFSIPIAVTGGILCSLVVAALDIFGGIRMSFDLELRDTMLLVFFSTIGLSAKLRLLAEGGRLLALLAVLTLLFLVSQNAVGLLTAMALGEPLAYGLIGGSVSLAGGHGTAITWGALGEEAGFNNATSLGLTFATFGLICGGLVGGPVAGWLIHRHNLSGPSESPPSEEGRAEPEADRGLVVSVTSRQVIRTILLLGVCVGVGAELNELLRERGTVLPGFLTAMGVGIVLTNVADLRGRPVDPPTVDLFNDVSLHLFLAMSLMSMQLVQLAGSLGGVLLVLAFQVVLATGFAVFVIFRFCGLDYAAAIMAAGYAGLGRDAGRRREQERGDEPLRPLAEGFPRDPPSGRVPARHRQRPRHPDLHRAVPLSAPSPASENSSPRLPSVR